MSVLLIRCMLLNNQLPINNMQRTLLRTASDAERSFNTESHYSS
jgi:hypothetical protein